MIKICICGFYYRPEFIKVMEMVHKRYPCYIVANDTPLKDPHIPMAVRENLGLEWGAYDFYLKNIWDRESPVLFLHDDIRFRPVIKDYEIISPIKIFNTINKLNHDQVYLFESSRKAEKNYYIHGRAFKCSGRFLNRLLEENGGFKYDENNDGHISGPTPKHCKHFNWGDYRFAEYIKTINGQATWEVGSYVILPALECATRGHFDIEIEGPVEV